MLDDALTNVNKWDLIVKCYLIIFESEIINGRIILPLLFSENIAVKFWEKDIAVKVGHDVGEIDQITPWMLKTFLNSTVTI